MTVEEIKKKHERYKKMKASPLQKAQDKVIEYVNYDLYYLGFLNAINTILNMDDVFTKEDCITYLKAMRASELNVYSDHIKAVANEMIIEYEEKV